MPYANNNKLSKTAKAGWIEISNEVYKELLFIQLGIDKNYKGFVNENGNIVKIERVEKSPPVIDYNDSVKKAKARIDKTAGETRLKYITEVPGQQGVYLEKMRQASDYLLNSPVSMDGFEYVVAESEALNVNYFEAATAIKNIADYWNKQLSPAIEKKRIEAKRQIDLLPETATVQDVLNITEAAIEALKQL